MFEECAAIPKKSDKNELFETKKYWLRCAAGESVSFCCN